jgi:peptidoglycan/LPS O-acetylase OafA/YrhL
LTYLGKISYGLYIYHLFAKTLLVALVSAAGLEQKSTVRVLLYFATAALTVLLASVSYRFFEMPFLKYKERFTFVKSRAA